MLAKGTNDLIDQLVDELIRSGANILNVAQDMSAANVALQEMREDLDDTDTTEGEDDDDNT